MVDLAMAEHGSLVDEELVPGANRLQRLVLRLLVDAAEEERRTDLEVPAAQELLDFGDQLGELEALVDVRV